MRSFILVVVTAFSLSIAGLIYFWTQVHHGRTAVARTTSTTNPRIRSVANGLGISEGDHVSVKKYDQRTGELASEFLSETYTPRRGGFVDVKNAAARFYVSKDQIIELRGATGTFMTDSPQEPKRKNLTETHTGAPNRGNLKDVTVTIIDIVHDPVHPTTRPSLTIKMDNAAFDSENATIVTEAYQDPKTGEVVPADRVPVTIRSPDTNPNGYDFDGYGMKMLWNERDHRLTSLDIIHGERLVIKNPKAVSAPKGPPSGKKGLTIAVPRVSQAIPGSEMASADKNAAMLVADTAETPAVRRRRRPAATAPVTQPTDTTTAATEPAARVRGGRRRPGYTEPPLSVPKLTTNVEPPIYRAEFHENVRIVQNNAELATAERMFVDFWMKSGGDDAATTQPGATGSPVGRRSHAATQPTTDVAVTQPSTAPTNSVAVTSAPATTTTKPATTSPDDAPIYIYWTGPLHVAPHSEISLASADKIVTLEGSPVVAKQQTSELRGSRVVYKTEDGSLKAYPLPNAPVELLSTDSRGKSIIHTNNLEYYSHAQPPTAVLSGHSTARLPQAENVMMDASWERRCTLRFSTLPDGGSAIKEADLTGDVHIIHPQMTLDSQRLELAFADPAKATTRPSTKPAVRVAAASASTSQPAAMAQTGLRQLVASEAVHCVMTDSGGKMQTIDGDRLTLLTDDGPDGKLVPHTVNVDGHAHTFDDQQDLKAEQLAITLAPTTRPANTLPVAAASPATRPGTRKSAGDDLAGGNVDLQSLVAQGNVIVIGKEDNTRAYADTMLIDKTLGKTNIKFLGGQPGAKIVQKSNTVIGPIIDIAREDQTLAVDGPGEMLGTQAEHEGEAAKPMDVTWKRNMRVDGKTNVVNAFGDVHAKTTENDGTVRIISAERARLLLADVAPSTQPSTKPATRVASTKSSTKPSGEAAGPKKEIRQAIFYDDARVHSELDDAQGLPIQRMNLKASELHYDVIPPDPKTATPGQEPDKRITIPVPGQMLVEDYKTATSQPTNDTSGGGMGSRGATAFQWEKSLVYDDTAGRAVMLGSVVIDHRDVDPKENVLKEESIHITGEEVIADIQQVPTTQPAVKGPKTATTRPEAPQRQVKSVLVRDHVHVSMKTGDLLADHVTYDPITKILMAYGTPEKDAVFTRAVLPAATQSTKVPYGGTQPIRAQVLEWDAGTDLPTIIQGTGTMRR